MMKKNKEEEEEEDKNRRMQCWKEVLNEGTTVWELKKQTNGLLHLKTRY